MALAMRRGRWAARSYRREWRRSIDLSETRHGPKTLYQEIDIYGVIAEKSGTDQRSALMSSYPHLLSSLQVAGVTLPNRMVMGAMHTRLETMDRPHERVAAFYAARAAGEIGLILTGGYSPVAEGVMDEGGLVLDSADQLGEHKLITSAVRKAGGHIVLQILHAGRYAKVASCVAPSPGKARINVYPPRALKTEEVWSTIDSFARTSALAQQGGYVGVEIMGSEGYLINEFTAALTNQRDDEFGGDFERRIRFPLEIVKSVRARVSREFMVIYRISSIDLMEGGMTAAEVAEFARRAEAVGADMINTGIGWHESSVPTMAAPVPRAAWMDAIRNVKQAVTIPVMASNRINTPDVAEKTIATRAAEINPCIACNQACLDRIFTARVATCLLNPRAGREIEFDDQPTTAPKRFAVVGGGPAGMAFAINAARRGHLVTLYEASAELGGQLNMAKKVTGKNEFKEMLSYIDVLAHNAPVGDKVAIIGAGGIGFDVADFLVGNAEESLDPQTFMQAWGVDTTIASHGGLKPPAKHAPTRAIHMFQRKPESLGKNLGKSTGWILKAKLRKAGVTMTAGAT